MWRQALLLLPQHRGCHKATSQSFLPQLCPAVLGPFPPSGGLYGGVGGCTSRAPAEPQEGHVPEGGVTVTPCRR